MDKFKPEYYKTGGIDVIEFCQRQELSYAIGNIIKYVVRAGRKDSEAALDDLKKAREYIDREIAFIEQNGEKDDSADIKAVPVEELESIETEKPLSILEELWRRNTEEGLKLRGNATDALEAVSRECPHDYGLLEGESWRNCVGNCAACWTRPYEEVKHD